MTLLLLKTIVYANESVNVHNKIMIKKPKGKKQSSKYEEGILALTRYFTITRQF